MGGLTEAFSTNKDWPHLYTRILMKGMHQNTDVSEERLANILVNFLVESDVADDCS